MHRRSADRYLVGDEIDHDVAGRQRHAGVTNVLVQRTDQPSLGAGEPVACPMVGAIANAFYDATGVPVHEAPLTPGRVRATLKAAGVI